MTSCAIQLPALHQACRDGDSNALSALFEHSSDRLELFHRLCEYDSSLGWTPAHWASYHGKTECLRRLLNVGLNIDVGDGRYNRTPAHIAAFAGHPHMLLWLIQAGADPNKQDDNGDTLVHHAARSGSNECLRLLESHNSYMCLPNKSGQTPYDVSILCGFDHCTDYLAHFQPQVVTSVQRQLKRSRDEDEPYQQQFGVKKICNGFTWPQQNNEINHNWHGNHDGDMVNQVNADVNGCHGDHEMEDAFGVEKDLYKSPDDKLYPSPTKLSLPQRCLGGHYM